MVHGPGFMMVARVPHGPVGHQAEAQARNDQAHRRLRAALPRPAVDLPLRHGAGRRDHGGQPAAAARAHRQRHRRQGRGRRHRGGADRRGGHAVRRAPRRGEPLLLLADRRGPHLRPAHPGLRPRAAPAAGVLHPRADRVAGQPPGRGRGRRAAGDRRHAVQRPVQRPVADRHPGHAVLPVLAGQPDRLAPDPAVHLPRAHGSAAACSACRGSPCSSTPRWAPR